MLKMNQKYIRMYDPSFGFGDYEVIFYTCDYKDKFEVYEEDWNNDGDVYTLVGQYMEIDSGHREFITEEDFKSDFYEYNPLEIRPGYIVDTERYEAYNKMQKIKHEETIFIYLENPFHHRLVTEDAFNKNFKTI